MTRVRDIEASITMVPTSEGGRHGPARTGYRPQFHYDDSEVWDAEHEYPDVDLVHPGETVRTYLRFASPGAHLARIVVGMPFTVREGARIVGNGVVTQVLDLPRSAERARRWLSRAAGDRASAVRNGREEPWTESVDALVCAAKSVTLLTAAGEPVIVNQLAARGDYIWTAVVVQTGSAIDCPPLGTIVEFHACQVQAATLT